MEMCVWFFGRVRVWMNSDQVEQQGRLGGLFMDKK